MRDISFYFVIAKATKGDEGSDTVVRDLLSRDDGHRSEEFDATARHRLQLRNCPRVRFRFVEQIAVDMCDLIGADHHVRALRVVGDGACFRLGEPVCARKWRFIDAVCFVDEWGNRAEFQSESLQQCLAMRGS